MEIHLAPTLYRIVQSFSQFVDAAKAGDTELLIRILEKNPSYAAQEHEVMGS